MYMLYKYSEKLKAIIDKLQATIRKMDVCKFVTVEVWLS